MSETAADYRKYLDPRTLAQDRVAGSARSADRRRLDDRDAPLAVSGHLASSSRSIGLTWRATTSGTSIGRSSARTDKVYLKQYQEETNLHLICIVDASESMGYGTVDGRDRTSTWTKYDHATAIAASLSYMAIQQQDSVGLAIFDQTLKRYFKPSNSPGQWKVVVNELQQVPRWNKTNTGKILDQLAEKLHASQPDRAPQRFLRRHRQHQDKACGTCATRSTR